MRGILKCISHVKIYFIGKFAIMLLLTVIFQTSKLVQLLKTFTHDATSITNIDLKIHTIFWILNCNFFKMTKKVKKFKIYKN